MIGVFDSGFGGLTVLKALLELIPDADYLYFGDTARLPYGSKSVETVARYAVEAAHYLESHGAELLLIACNTATALALDRITAAAHVPVLGVVEPGAEAAASTKLQIGDRFYEGEEMAEYPLTVVGILRPSRRNCAIASISGAWSVPKLQNRYSTPSSVRPSRK